MTILQLDDYTAEIFYHPDSRWRQFENELLDVNVSLPLPHRIEWALANPSTSYWFVGVRDERGNASCGFAIAIGASHALPGHRIFQIERFGPALTDKGREVALRGFAQFVRTHQRILRANLDVISPDTSVRDNIANTVTDLGFRKVAEPRSYTDTIVIDLRPSESEILASLHATARRHIRAIDKNSITLRPITEQRYAERMKHLSRETMTRTGGSRLGYDWAAIIKLSEQYPTLSRLSGVFSDELPEPDALLAFAWGRNHGDHVDYGAAASTRLADLKVPLGYGPVWDLICWAKSNGATWFDFGGITAGSHRSDDRLGGISDFKRYFSRNVITVGAEWVFQPHSFNAKLANTVSASTAWVRKLFTPIRFPS